MAVRDLSETRAAATVPAGRRYAGRSGVPAAARRRRLQIALGALWLLDAALQFQPFMFTGPSSAT